MAMTEAARQARNAYKREWYKRNPGKRRQYEETYWQRRIQSERQETEENGSSEPMKEGEQGVY